MKHDALKEYLHTFLLRIEGMIAAMPGALADTSPPWTGVSVPVSVAADGEEEPRVFATFPSAFAAQEQRVLA